VALQKDSWGEVIVNNHTLLIFAQYEEKAVHSWHPGDAGAETPAYAAIFAVPEKLCRGGKVLFAEKDRAGFLYQLTFAGNST